MKRSKFFLYALLSGILFSIAWPPIGFPVILFIAFVPLLYIEDIVATEKNSSSRFILFTSSFFAFLIWNITSTFWVCNASVPGGIAAILLNSLIMAVVFLLFHTSKKKMIDLGVPVSKAIFLLPVFWIGYEFFHHRWDVTWPWLTLGNAFAANHTWIQWYEYTGVPGGSLWVLIINVLLYSCIKKNEWRNIRIQLVSIGLILIVPILISLYLYDRCNPLENSSVKNKISVVVVQPNIDPFSEKFSSMNYKEQLDKMLVLAAEKVDSTTDYLVFPETALTENIWENDIYQTSSIRILKTFLEKYPKLKIVVGASTSYVYEQGENPSVTARKFKRQDGYYDSYNTALQIDNTDSIQIYHKSKLVPGVERMPYPAVFGFLENLSIDLGGTAGSLGTQEIRGVFKSSSGSMAPVICYESIYGEFVTDYIKNDASVIFIITNDGWWRDTPGYKQHLLYGRLRAIETRRCIARSANTGISCFINERGDFSQETGWWVPAAIKETICLNSEKTFYVNNGEIIGRVCFYTWLLVLVILFSLRFIKK